MFDSLRVIFRYNMGKGGVFVRSGGGLGSGLCSPWSSFNRPYHCGLHGRVCPQESDLLVKKKRRLGERPFFFSLLFPLFDLCDCCESYMWVDSRGGNKIITDFFCNSESCIHMFMSKELLLNVTGNLHCIP